MRVRAVVVVACVGLVCGLRPLASQEPTFAARLETLRTQSNLPAVAGATFSSAEVSAVSAIGVRKMGDTTPVTPDDLWHIGSITKSLTSLLTAKFVERGEMSWTSTLGDLLGPRAGKFAPVTLAQLLSHRAGLPANVLPGMMASVAQGAPTVDVQRQRVIDAALATDPTAAPGAAYLYSNLGYIIAGAILEAPSLAHPFGTDALGRDLFSRVLYGARIALWVALLGTAISALLGLSLGLLAGFYAGWLDQGLSRTMDVWMAFPGLLLAIIIVARLGPSLDNAVIALGIIGAPAFYRLMRGGALGQIIDREALYRPRRRAEHEKDQGGKNQAAHRRELGPRRAKGKRNGARS